MLGAARSLKFRPRSLDLGAAALAAIAFLAGAVLRWSLRDHTTADTFTFLLPWYRFAHAHGLSALGRDFTNYTPFYSYLLLIAARFDPLASPLILVKAISVCFEFGCALIVANMVLHVTKAPVRTAVAFSSVWLAPTVLLNGAAWGQADSIWAFFVLWSISLWVRGRNGVPAFAAGFAVKAQAVFLGPLVLAMLLRRRRSLAWLAVVPAVYLAFALPVLIAGRPIGSVMTVYLSQAETYRRLTMNAANIWVFAGALPYGVGVVLGLAMGAIAGLALSFHLSRSRRDETELVLLGACASLLLMPLVLPKMHERYFFAFELAAIGLACIHPRYIAFPVLAQATGVLAYLAFDMDVTIGVPAAALCNILLACYLVAALSSGASPRSPGMKVWLGFAASGAALLAYALLDRSATTEMLSAKLLTLLLTASAFRLLSDSFAGSTSCGGEQLGSAARPVDRDPAEAVIPSVQSVSLR